ncbi:MULTISPECIES: ATP-binding protein [unclassified Sphingomonas]|uniref:sensor histidine kinase n=1 Tax=unclassified Sphingomonas TaxID=196159 RepID=UPI002865284D|nr:MULTISPECIES: ATP-binding protein [unclassified Sphingomonas]MDR6115860.1 two-component system phosphate regulon sensor histidine kinase PhoR [Sphingomonas sp. SORGH_AS_0789]MDR6150469.1 two-component system phosphate regulon sensor histidine kinase PhoR [Sphingomonas sp. SORGH_AS_0742]
MLREDRATRARYIGDIMGFGIRTLWGIVVAVVAAVVVFLTAGPGPAIITLVGGIAAALVASEGEATDAEEDDRQVEDGDTLSPLLTEALDAIVEPVLLIERGRVTLANRAARTLLGAHIVGEDARIAIRHPAAAERLMAPGATAPDHPISLVGLGSLDHRWEMRLADTSGGQRIVHLIDQTAHDAAERMRVDFVANASHELRTPLASILGFIETLGDEAGEDAEIRARFLKVMFDEARRMQRLVEDLISLSRIEADKYRQPAQPVAMADLVQHVWDEFLDSGSPRAEDIGCDVAEGLPPIAGDRAQLSQMLHNLIGNAMKYGRAETPVRVTLDCDGPMLRLTVADRGEGIAPGHIPRLTERFYRVDSGRSRSIGGTGLGLAIVKHIVERHRGRLDIASEVGVGTTVTVRLPPIKSSEKPVSEGAVTKPQ